MHMALSLAQPIRFRGFAKFKIILAHEHECTRSVLLQCDMHYVGATEPAARSWQNGKI